MGITEQEAAALGLTPGKPKRRRKADYREKDFTSDVIQLAMLLGWWPAHFRPAMLRDGRWVTAVQGRGKGFPDLVMVRAQRTLYAELKMDRTRPTPEQSDWLDRLRTAGNEVYLWRPQDWREIEVTLA